MTFNHNLANEFLEAIFPIPEQFGVILQDNDIGEFVGKPINYNILKTKLQTIDPDVNLYFGMSKLVILSPQLGDVAVKIPFNGYFTSEQDDKNDSKLHWHPFRWASGSDPSDYCLAEYEKYLKLITYDLDDFVAKTNLFRIIDQTYIFVQEFVISEDDDYEDHQASHKSQDLANRWYEERKFDIDSEWIANCIDKYGKSKVKRFLNYCNNIDLDILGDTHLSNYGYRKDGTPCLLDFSNFLE